MTTRSHIILYKDTHYRADKILLVLKPGLRYNESTAMYTLESSVFLEGELEMSEIFEEYTEDVEKTSYETYSVDLKEAMCIHEQFIFAWKNAIS